MNERQWLTCTDPAAMLRYIAGKGRVRQARLFVSACCRRIWHLLSDPRSRAAIEVEERYLDGQATREEATRAYEEARQAARGMGPAVHLGARRAGAAGAVLAYDLSASPAFPSGMENYTQAATYAVWYANPDRAVDAWDEERAAQCDLLRDIIGNPFRPWSIDPAWHTPTAIAIARTAYEERILPAGIFDRAHLPILADALEEAGCTEEDILAHCRLPIDHVRGCWVVDAILGKS